ncbi:MAG: pyrroline-5-carboxylate reductase, partial [Candidatus Omnitrophica bacterium]|nr:pyrroline-5-carboxylate reductase [Candidatus Omnitrophota bacterium]
MKRKIGISGCGNMGSAIVHKIVGLGIISVFDTNKGKLKTVTSIDKKSIKSASDNKKLARSVDVLILAVKPKDITVVLDDIRDELPPRTLLISIAAGVTTKFIEKQLGKKIAIIRVMPNMPALIGAGISAICKGTFAVKKDIAEAKALFLKLGQVVEVKEDLMDAVTAISGSGPAYFFYLTEVLTTAGIGLGLDKETAHKLAVETAFGSAKLLKETGEKAGALRARVTSKGGTTE